MKILFAAPEDAWGGFFSMVKNMLPEHEFIAQDSFGITELSGIDILIPTMSRVTETELKTADRLRLIQQCGAGLDMVDVHAARNLNIPVANVPSDISGNADSVAEIAIYMMIGLSRNIEGMEEGLRNRIMGGPTGLSLKGRTVGVVGLVDYTALKRALQEKQIAGAGVDVFWEEPSDPADEIFQYNIMATPHIGGATDISMQGIADGVAGNIKRIAKGDIPVNQAVG